MNVSHFTGRLTRDPELNEYGGTSKVSFSLAISKKRKNKDTGEYDERVHYFDFFAWASGADAIARYFKKGSLITVHCEPEQERWEKDGQKFSVVRFRVTQFEFPPFNSPPDKGAKSDSGSNSQPSQSSAPEGNDGGDDGDIPF